jgi:hypothetical protein
MKQVKIYLRISNIYLFLKEYELYKKEVTKRENDYEKKLKEQDSTIQDLALKLEVTIKREDEFREKDGLRSSTWVKDVNVKECWQCKKDFNPLRRKHHCRRYIYHIKSQNK